MSTHIRSMKERDYEMIPVNKIRVLNSRNRDEEQFKRNVESIDEMGLLKPIMVNKRHLDETGFYDLICGEGRFIAFQRLGKATITAEVVDFDDKLALLISMVENIARVPPRTMWFAYEMKRMHDSGMSFSEIGRIVRRDSTWVSNYIHLVSQGEERLIKGVEQRLFPMHFAVRVARTADAEIQHVLMDAFDQGIVNASNIDRVKKLIDRRVNRAGGSSKSSKGYALKDLKQDIRRLTKEKDDFVREATEQQRRMLLLISGLQAVTKDEAFVQLMSEQDIPERPALEGSYQSAL